MTIPRAALLVEDNALIAAHIRDVLEHLGFASVHICHSLAAASDLLRQKRFDFALVIVNDHEGDAGAVGTLLAAAETPFAFISDYRDGRDLPSGLADRPFLIKPYDEGELAGLLHKLALPEDGQPALMPGGSAPRSVRGGGRSSRTGPRSSSPA